jgi:uncharacterized protein YrrD
MIKANSVLGKQLLSRADGEKLGSVKDVIVGKDRTRVVALLLSEGGFFSKPTVVPLESVVNFGKDAVVITDSQAVVKADHVPTVAQALEIDQNLTGRKVFSEQGDHYGKLADIYFDDKTGEIMGVDVTGVGEGSAAKKTNFLGRENIVSFGADALVISAAGASMLTDQVAPPVASADATTAAPTPEPSPLPNVEDVDMEMPSMATTDAPAAVARVSDDEAGMGEQTQMLGGAGGPPSGTDGSTQ